MSLNTGMWPSYYIFVALLEKGSYYVYASRFLAMSNMFLLHPLSHTVTTPHPSHSGYDLAYILSTSIWNNNLATSSARASGPTILLHPQHEHLDQQSCYILSTSIWTNNLKATSSARAFGTTILLHPQHEHLEQQSKSYILSTSIWNNNLATSSA